MTTPDKHGWRPGDTFDQAIDLLGRVSLLAQLRDKVQLAVSAAVPKCGRCDHWMKSRACPRERNVNGRPSGPNCNAFPCDKYAQSLGSALTCRQLQQEAMDFAIAHDLPLPPPPESET